jgi:2-oxoglutarate/2-oxoacid ferredoxin oxidoreductase subunit beta
MTPQTSGADGARPLTRKDFSSDQEVRWCPGCGDYAVLATIQKVLPSLGVPKEKFVFVSGIGCSSRFPYYMDTYGIHGIHGRATAIATGVKLANPDLSVWVATGDGDATSIGGNHLIHIIRRNPDINIILFNNRIYGLTKGQFSPTSELGKATKSSPWGNIDRPLNPIALALGANATFVARTIDREPKHMAEVIKAAHAHKGCSFVEVLQNCNVFNDGAFVSFTDKKLKNDNVVRLVEGEPLLFGKEKDKGVTMQCRGGSEVVDLAGDDPASRGVIIHDPTHDNMTYASMLAHMGPPETPLPIGVLRRVEATTYEAAMYAQIDAARKQAGPGDIDELIRGRDAWVVE